MTVVNNGRQAVDEVARDCFDAVLMDVVAYQTLKRSAKSDGSRTFDSLCNDRGLAVRSAAILKVAKE
jgi:hypothetical protein